jgi:hypothetical protein
MTNAAPLFGIIFMNTPTHACTFGKVFQEHPWEFRETLETTQLLMCPEDIKDKRTV